MKTLKLFLTVPENAELGEIQINIDNYLPYFSKLPWFEGENNWRTTMILALNATKFDRSKFLQDQKIWMVSQGWLNDTETHFTSDILKKIGQDIYNTLFPMGEARNLLSRILGNLKTNEQLHIQLQFSEKIDKRGRLPDYPWELACDERGFLAQRQVTFSRLIAFPENIPNLSPVNEINVLLVSSTVGDLDSEIDLDLPKLSYQEQEAILESLKKAKIAVECKKDISFKRLGDYLTQIPPEKAPHIIHFDGHGFFGKRCNNSDCRTIHGDLTTTHCRKCNSPLEPNPQGYLLFNKSDINDKVQGTDYISAAEISELIRKSNLGLENKPNLGVRLVVMSACKSGWALISDSVFNGLAQQLISQQIPAVVAMQYNVAVDAATAFAERFYQALVNKKPLTIAVSVGRAAMGREGNQWYRPALYLRWDNNDGGQLFAETEEITPTLERYVKNLAIELEGYKGVLEYVDLSVQTTLSPTHVASDSQYNFAPGLDILASQSNTENEKNIRELSLENVAANNKKFVLIGESGSGKSTVLKRMVLTQAKQFLSDPFTVQMPFVLQLGLWYKDIDFISFLKRKWQDFYLPDINIQDFFAEGKAILYLDGLDAIPGNFVNKANEIKNWLHSSKAPKQVIVTCRLDYYLDDDINLGLSTFEIKPMSAEQIRSLVRRELKDESDNFLGQILLNADNNNKHSLQQFASNPYLLYALILIYQLDPNNRLPQNSGALFSRLVRALWKRERQKPTAELLPYSEIETYFASLADYMFQQDSLIAKFEDAISCLNSDRDLLLAGQSANLLVIQDDTVRFFHQLVRDYFVAVTLKNKSLNSILKKPKIYNGKRLRERSDYPIIALCGLVNDPNKIVKQIAELDPYLATMCLDSGVKVSNETLKFVVSQLIQGFDITIQDNFEESIRFENIGNIKKQLAKQYLSKLDKNVVLILANMLIDSQQNAFIKSAIIELLDIYNDTRTIPFLSAFIQEPSIEETAIQLANQQLIRLKAALIASGAFVALTAMFGKRINIALSTVQDAWARGWGDRSQSSKLQLRVQAIYALGRLKDKDATLPLIKCLIDLNSDVRQACLNNLQSRDWQPETEKEQLYLLIAQNRWSDCKAFGESATFPLLSVLDAEAEATQIDIITTLGELGLKAKAADLKIIGKLFDEKTSVALKQSCIEAMSLMPTEAAVLGLLKASQTFSDDLQSLAIKKLNNINESAKVAGLIYALKVDFSTIITTKINSPIGKIFKGDDDLKLKKEAIKILGQIGTLDAINALLLVMNNENERLVIAAMNSLSNHQQLNVISAIVKKLKDDKNYIKKEAIKSLGKLQASTAINELVKMLPPPQKQKLFRQKIFKISPFSEASLVDDILDALQQIGTPEALQAIDRWHSEKNNGL